MIADKITGLLDKVPALIEGLRNAITKVLGYFSIQDSTSSLIMLIIALGLAYLFLKQFVTQSLFLKLSTILNWILLGVLIYVLIVYV